VRARRHRLHLTEYLDRCAGKVDFVFGMDNNAALRRIAEGLDPSA
jgi:hypothetical protein